MRNGNEVGFRTRLDCRRQAVADLIENAFVKKIRPVGWDRRIRADQINNGNPFKARLHKIAGRHKSLTPCYYDSYGNRLQKAVNVKPKGWQVGEKLTKKGFKCLGSGHFSRVYGKEGSDRVIKISHQPDNWIDYVVWADKLGYAGNLAPKVFSYKYNEKGNYSISIVERMECTLHKLDTKHDHHVTVSMFEKYKAGNTLAGCFLEEIVPTAASFVDALKKEFEGDRFDLHNGNFMVRPDGTFCLTDPVCNEFTGKYKRLKTKDFTVH